MSILLLDGKPQTSFSSNNFLDLCWMNTLFATSYEVVYTYRVQLESVMRSWWISSPSFSWPFTWCELSTCNMSMCPSLSGPTCLDPGRPLDGLQVTTSYEEYSLVHWNCLRPGYQPDPPTPIMCVYNASATPVPLSWNGSVPVCVGEYPGTWQLFQGSQVMNSWLKGYPLLHSHTAQVGRLPL